MADAFVAVTDAGGVVRNIDNETVTTGAGEVYRQRVSIAINVTTGSTAGPASYATGGFVVDLTATYSTVDFFVVAPTVIGALPPCHYEYGLNSPSNGKVTVKPMRHRYDRATPVGNVSGQPGGVTVQAAAVATGSNAAVVSGVNNAQAVDALGSGNAQNTNHTHSHTHSFANLYQHQHALTLTETDDASVEVAAATDLSATTWRWLAVGS